MKTQISITETSNQISLVAPFSAANNEIYRSRGGKFDKGATAWVFPSTPATRTMIEEMLGAESPLVQARITEDKVRSRDNEWLIGGYKLACRRGRDYRVETPEGVQLEQGSWCSAGGSVKNPRVTGNNVVLNVIVRRAFAEREGLEIISAGLAEITNPLAAFSDAQLLAELRRRESQSVAA